MKKILLLSDTHGYTGIDLLPYIKECDELWHAGDIGSIECADFFEQANVVFRAVYGNIDDKDLRLRYPETLDFMVEDLRVLIVHIGGYPGRYEKGIKNMLKDKRPGLFITGHSHIARVIRDTELDILHMNPGSCGHQGFHPIRTMLRFRVEGKDIAQLELIELGRRGRLKNI